ncbi:unnamed protein product, partial [Rotaria magnacalcarata]
MSAIKHTRVPPPIPA